MRRFEWHEAKARSNLRKHGVSFELACEALLDPESIEEPDPFSVGEERFLALGKTVDATLLVVVYALWYDDGVEVVRVISARKAKQHERRRYEDAS